MAEHTTHTYPAERLIAYSDAIFSIVVTLLVLEIRLPEHSEYGVLNDLFQEWPSIISFLISFFIITVIWMNHHEMFHHIKRVDYRLIVLNTLLMLNVVLIPLASSMLGRHLLESQPELINAAFIYGLWIAIGGIPFNLLWSYVSRQPHLLKEDADPAALQRLSRHYWRGPLFYLLATLSSLISQWLAIVGYVALLGLYFVPASLWMYKKK